ALPRRARLDETEELFEWRDPFDVPATSMWLWPSTGRPDFFSKYRVDSPGPYVPRDGTPPFIAPPCIVGIAPDTLREQVKAIARLEIIEGEDHFLFKASAPGGQPLMPTREPAVIAFQEGGCRFMCFDDENDEWRTNLYRALGLSRLSFESEDQGIAIFALNLRNAYVGPQV
ncbi:hypothetical protein LCGC14_0309310, partial [marine sediment metagenome]